MSNKCKRLMAFLLMCVLAVLSLAGCGSKKDAQDAYENLNSASDMVTDWGTDIYQIWLVTSSGSFKDFDDICDQVHGLTRDELIDGLIGYLRIHATDWTEDSVDTVKEHPGAILVLATQTFDCEVFDVCVEMVVQAYIENGKSDQIKSYLDNAKEEIKKCNDSKSYYASLKEYYNTVNSYYAFCQQPQGSLDQVETTINDYHNTMRDCKNDLELDLEK